MARAAVPPLGRGTDVARSSGEPDLAAPGLLPELEFTLDGPSVVTYPLDDLRIAEQRVDVRRAAFRRSRDVVGHEHVGRPQHLLRYAWREHEHHVYAILDELLVCGLGHLAADQEDAGVGGSGTSHVDR